jgi:hypothetical protein
MYSVQGIFQHHFQSKKERTILVKNMVKITKKLKETANVKLSRAF